MRSWHVHLGKLERVLPTLPDNTFDGVFCDPPYGITFAGSAWDYQVPKAPLWREVLRVLKPGAPLIAFSATRTYHRMAVEIEDGGFEICDMLTWLYGQGMPKYLDISKALDKAAGKSADRAVVGSKKGVAAVGGKGGHGAAEANVKKISVDLDVTKGATALSRAWDGYATALKPACEPAVLACKPLEGTYAQNVKKWGVGGLNIAGTRVGDEVLPEYLSGITTNGPREARTNRTVTPERVGRWPSNVVLDEEAAAGLEAQAPGAARYFYTAKPSQSEREAGLEGLPAPPPNADGSAGTAKNSHPTVKPVALAEYFTRLILPPTGGSLLVPFSGSGSEMVGALRAGWTNVYGIEWWSPYVHVARAPLAAEVKRLDEASRVP